MPHLSGPGRLRLCGRGHQPRLRLRGTHVRVHPLAPPAGLLLLQHGGHAPGGLARGLVGNSPVWVCENACENVCVLVPSNSSPHFASLSTQPPESSPHFASLSTLALESSPHFASTSTLTLESSTHFASTSTLTLELSPHFASLNTQPLGKNGASATRSFIQGLINCS